VNTVLCTIPLSEVAREAASVPLKRIADGSGHAHLGSKPGWIRGLSLTRVRPGESHPFITQAVDALGAVVHRYDVKQILINNLEPGAELSIHRDGYPQNDRFHLPLITNPSAYWWDEIEGRTHMLSGWWYGPVPYCGILHSAGNPGTSDRLHLIVDFEHVKGN
jgi:hypothetical protein